MQLEVKGKNVEVSDSIRSYAESKLRRLERQLSDPTVVELELAVERNPSIAENQVAEATVWTKGPVLRAREASSDMKASIDQLANKLARQVKRYREKRVEEPRRGDHPAPAVESLDGPEPLIVKSKQFPVKPMSPDEAVLQLELVGHDFFVFQNAESADVNVVYRRRDGSFGLIEPQLQKLPLFRRERLHERLAREGGLDDGGLNERPPGAQPVEPGRRHRVFPGTTASRGRGDWDAVVMADAPDLPGNEVDLRRSRRRFGRSSTTSSRSPRSSRWRRYWTTWSKRPTGPRRSVEARRRLGGRRAAHRGAGDRRRRRRRDRTRPCTRGRDAHRRRPAGVRHGAGARAPGPERYDSYARSEAARRRPLGGPRQPALSRPCLGARRYTGPCLPPATLVASCPSSARSRRSCASAKAGASSGSPSRRPTSPRSSPSSRSSPTTSCAARRPSSSSGSRTARRSRRCSSRRTPPCARHSGAPTGMRLFDVQLMGGIVLHEGDIAEMKTGEGKTFVASQALYLNALDGQQRPPRHGQRLPRQARLGVDAAVYERSGMPVASIQNIMPFDQRVRCYEADITYGTNSEFGFDYLRDNMAVSLDGTVQRGPLLRDRGRGRLDPHRRGADAADHLRRAGDGGEDLLRLRARRAQLDGAVQAAVEDRGPRRPRRRLHVTTRSSRPSRRCRAASRRSSARSRSTTSTTRATSSSSTT